MPSREKERLYEKTDAHVRPWRKWGPYVSERAWGTVREDYSADGNAWAYFPHDHARSRAYRWGEDGIAGFCDRYQILCFGNTWAWWSEARPPPVITLGPSREGFTAVKAADDTVAPMPGLPFDYQL